MPKNFSYFIKLSITLLITVLFIGAIEYTIGFATILTAWQNLSPTALMLAITLMFISYFLRAMRIYSYFSLTTASQYRLCVKTTLLHNFLNNLLPMRSGEISLPVMLKRYFSINTLDAIVALLFFRMLDLHVLGLILIGAGFFLYSPPWPLLCLAIALWLAIPFIILRFRNQIQNRLQALSDNKISGLIYKLVVSFPGSQAQLLTAYWWTFINWLVKLLVLSWVILQFHAMSGEAALVSVIFADASSVLPIHGVAGIGTYEAGAVIGASLLGKNAEAILPAAINLHLFVFGASALGALLGMLLPRNKIV